MTRPERKPWFSRNIGWDRFVCARTGQEVTVTTVEFAGPQDYNALYPVVYLAETIVWVGKGLERIAELKRYSSVEQAQRSHGAIVRRAKR